MNKFLIKKIAFFVLLISFFAISSILIIDAQGYGFDFKKRQLVKVGGINIRSLVLDVNVFVDNDHKGKTSNFSRDILIQKLIPGEYRVKVEKTNYQTWEKTLIVEGQKVTKAENVYLFPENINFQLNVENIADFFLSENKENIIYLTNNQEIIFKETVVLNSINSKKYFKNIENIQFFPDLKLILIKGKNNQDKYNYYYIELTKPNILNNLSFLETTDVFYLDKQSIVYKKGKDIALYSLSTQKSSIIKKDIDIFTFKNNELYFIENNLLVKMSNNKEIILSEKEISIKNYNLSIIFGKIFAYNDSSLYVFNDYKKEFDLFLKTSELIYDILPDKIILSTGSELWLFLLRDFESPFFKKEGSLIFLSRLSSKIENLIWFNSDHFFYTTNNNVFVSEIDNRDNINIFQISQLPVQKIWFNEKTLYILSNNNIYISDKFNP